VQQLSLSRVCFGPELRTRQAAPQRIIIVLWT
jgi:hypothetical protein